MSDRSPACIRCGCPFSPPASPGGTQSNLAAQGSRKIPVSTLISSILSLVMTVAVVGGLRVRSCADRNTLAALSASLLVADAPAAASAASEPSSPASAASAHVSVFCVPSCDEVELDGEKLGPSPVLMRSMSGGNHKIAARRADVVMERHVSAAPGQGVAVRYLEP